MTHTLILCLSSMSSTLFMICSITRTCAHICSLHRTAKLSTIIQSMLLSNIATGFKILLKIRLLIVVLLLPIQLTAKALPLPIMIKVLGALGCTHGRPISLSGMLLIRTKSTVLLLFALKQRLVANYAQTMRLMVKQWSNSTLMVPLFVLKSTSEMDMVLKTSDWATNQRMTQMVTSFGLNGPIVTTSPAVNIPTT